MVISHAPAFDAWLDAFFVSYFRRRPVNATFIGVHDYDDRLPDLSEEGIAATLADAEDLLRRLRTLPTEPLTPAQVLDHQLAEGFLKIQRWESKSAHFGAVANPTLFTGEAIFGLVSLLLRRSPPLDQVLSRLAAVPALLEVGARQVKSAPEAWIARARHECEGAHLLLRDTAPIYPKLADATRSAASAFGRFDEHLARDVMPCAEYAAGGEALDVILHHAHALDMDADELERLALDRIAEEEAALANPPPADDAPPVLPDEPYLEKFTRLWCEVRHRATECDLLTFPDWPVRFVERPRWAENAAPYLYFLPYRSPAPFDHVPEHDYLVPPGSDDSTIKLNHVIHHASIGHHVQNWFAARATSRIGQIAAVDCASRIAMLCGGTMAEGWACYATDLAEECGLLTPSEAYGQHHARLRMAARAVVDIRLHQGRFTLDEAIRFYVERVGMPAAAARSEAVKNSLFPGAACMYLAGWDAIWKLRRDLESGEGATFSLHTFHDRLLSFGSVPVSLIAQSIGEETCH